MMIGINFGSCYSSATIVNDLTPDNLKMVTPEILIADHQHENPDIGKKWFRRAADAGDVESSILLRTLESDAKIHGEMDIVTGEFEEVRLS